MTLSEFKSKFFSRPTISPPTTLYVFESEDSADNWIKCKYFNSDDHSYELDMVIQSDMVLRYTVKEKWCKAEVQQFYAVEPDVIVVVVELQESEEAKEKFDVAIQALEREPVLDKIRAEIEQYLFQNEFGSEYRKEVSQIIDKYRAEGSEEIEIS